MRQLLTLACLCLAFVAACGDDDDCVQCPGGGQPQPTMANIWPHGDGASWLYDLDYREFQGHALPAEAPPLPPLASLREALEAPVETNVIDMNRGLYRLRLDGEITTESGVTAQRMLGTLYRETDGLTARAAGDGLLRVLAAARPDLRGAILARHPHLALKSLDDAWPPLLLSGLAFAYEDSGYYGYGDLDQEHSWIYLEGDLTAGSQFSLQLIPELASDVWLYGQIWSIDDRTIGGVLWRHAVECLYAVDLGVVTVVDEGGNPLGETRGYVYGVTIFAPGVGPVACHERQVLGPATQNQLQPGIFEYECVLAGERVRN